MAQKLNSRQQRERYAQAVELAKKGQYSKARYILRDMDGHAKAKALLNKIEGRNDKLQGGLSAFYSGTLLAIVFIGIVIIAIAWSATNFFANENEAVANVGNEYTVRGLTGGQGFYVDLYDMCVEVTGTESPECLDWAATIITDHEQSVRLCVRMSEDNRILLRELTPQEVTACMVEQGAPPPPTA